MKTKIENYKRKDLFKLYDNYTKPFASVTTKLDVTNIYKLSQKHGHFYATMGYYLTKAMSEIEEFRVTYEEGEFYLHDTIVPSYVELLEDGTIGFFDVPLTQDYEEYLKSFDETKKRILKGEKMPLSTDAVVWLSCEPWFKASAIDPPFDKDERVSQLIWDQYELENDRCYVDLTVFFHHGFIDGSHIGELLKLINEQIDGLSIK